MVIIGAGAGVLNMHRPGIELETTQVVGVTDVNAEAAQKVADTYGCPMYADYKTMLAEAKPDVAVILVGKTSEDGAMIQIHGDEDLYPAGTFIEPLDDKDIEVKGSSPENVWS